MPIKKAITSWSLQDRPREKLMFNGASILTDAELLAILIGSGNREESAVELCRRILTDVNNDLISLARLNLKDLTKYKGMGEAKAISILAAMELGRRRRDSPEPEKPLINSSSMAYSFLKRYMEDLIHEEFWVLLLDAGLKLLKTQQISKGGMQGTIVDSKLVFKAAIENNAHGIILAHNHPSGRLKPSESDIKLTKKIVLAATSLDLVIRDHLIITSSSYFSFNDQGLL